MCSASISAGKMNNEMAPLDHVASKKYSYCYIAYKTLVTYKSHWAKTSNWNLWRDWKKHCFQLIHASLIEKEGNPFIVIYYKC